MYGIYNPPVVEKWIYQKPFNAAVDVSATDRKHSHSNAPPCELAWNW
jgi:hypothetical protein